MDEKQSRKSEDTVFPIITLSVTMETSGRIRPNFELIQALMYVINTCKYEKDTIKNNQEQELSHDSIARLNCALPIIKTISVIR